jgi:PAS domain S-box-containing protein
MGRPELPEQFPDGRACFRELMSHVNLFAVMFNPNAEIIYCNGHFVRMTGLSIDEVMGRHWDDIFVSPWSGDFPIHFSDWIKIKPAALHHESDLLTRDGERYWVRWNSIPLRDSEGTIVGVASIGEDITERRRLERALLDSSARERRNLEGELHDGLGQELYGLVLSARGLAETAKRDNQAIAEDLDRLALNLNHAIDTSRRISRGFSPLSEQKGGLVDALRNLANTPKDWSGPELHFSLVKNAPLTLPEETLDHIYRLAQEGVTNALRHADANSIRIILNIQRTIVTLEILDDGVGLAHAESSAGMGLKLMRYRANVLRAQIHIAKGLTRGTHVMFRIEQ